MQINYITLHYITLHYITLHYITLHRTLSFVPLNLLLQYRKVQNDCQNKVACIFNTIHEIFNK